MSKFLNPKYQSFPAYVPGEQPLDRKYIKLNTNESPYPPSEGVVRAINAAEVRDLRLYSDPECHALRKSLAEFYGVLPENIYVSNGSDDILNFAFMAYSGEGVLFPEISYGFYRVFADLYASPYRAVPLKVDFSIDAADYCGQNRMIVIANPNAPTGISLSLSEIEKIVCTNPEKVVIIDEAYVDFGAESAYRLTQKYPNLLVVMTFSKSRSLAGARLGFAIAGKELISDLEKLKYSTNPYNLNRLTLRAGQAALEEADYYRENCRRIIDTREKTALRLRELGFEVLPSRANFLFVRSNSVSGEALYRGLREKGILIRHFTDEKISDFNRITIGTAEEMEILLEKISEMLGEAV